jgi:ABC-type polysaccharide/polyol phosphate transport system ATPase subunit
VSDVALRMEHVFKKFRKGEMYDSLRDLIPALTGKLFRRQELDKNDQREFWALRDISFEVKKGEAFGIIGHNGAGKSTALKILSRIMKPTNGHMVVNGRLSALIEVTAGFHQDLTGRENIFLHGAILGMTKREIQSKLDQIIAFSGIEEFIDTPVKRYSSGMHARLGFSVAAHVDPEVLIVDEVLSVGDWLFQRKCIERMKDVIHSGATVLFVSHNLKTISEFCDRCMLLERGRAIMTGPAHEVVSTYLQQSRSSPEEASDETPVIISKVKVRNEYGECTRFKSGERAWVDAEVTTRARCTKLAVVLYITNDNDEIFETSTERLGHGSITLEPGEVFTCTFEVRLNVNTGIYHPSIMTWRHLTQSGYEQQIAAATIYVSSEDDMTGIPHFFPRVVQKSIRPTLEANCVLTTARAADGRNPALSN